MSMDLPNEYRYPDGPPDMLEQEEYWAEALGNDHGYNRIGTSHDERAQAQGALRGPFTKRPYLRGYKHGFERRKGEEHGFDIFGALDMAWLRKDAEADQEQWGPWTNYTRR